MSLNVHEIDRTGILDQQRCPRSRYLSRHFNGTGIEKIRKSLPLVFGGAFHEGVELLLTNKGIDAAIERANQFLDESFTNSSVDLEEKETTSAIAEQKAIAEGLIRGWWAHDGERFLRDFEVIEVEKEGRAELAPGMVLMFRPDALVRERISGDLYIVSWKTASTFGQYTINQIQTDMQSMSEVWGVEQASEMCVDEGCPEPHPHVHPSDKLRIEGVLYLFAVKGQRRMDDYLGFKTQDTPLAYGWMRPGSTPDDCEWAFRYKWQTEEINPKTGKPMWSQLGKGFRKVSVWDNYPGGIKAWIEALSKQEITPRHINALEAIFPQSMPVSRRADEIESWRRQVVGQESRVIDALLDMKYPIYGDSDRSNRLDEFFPQSTARCMDYNSKCSFWECCHLPAVKADPLASGLYKIRVPNHPSEKGAGDD